MNGSDVWNVSALVEVKDLQGRPLIGPRVEFVSDVTEDGVPVRRPTSFSGDLNSAGKAQTAEHSVDLEYKEGWYVNEVRWVVSFAHEGHSYSETLFCAPLLRVEDEEDRHRLTEFHITIDSI